MEKIIGIVIASLLFCNIGFAEMKMIRYIIVALVIVLGLSTSSFADYKYNAFTGEWENVGTNYDMTYDPFNSEWSYQKPDAQLEYNPWTGEWEYER